jgi:acyl-CoA hydrolase
VAGLIEDGATLQLGIGGIPDAVLLELTQHRDLGVQTEMLSDSVIPLIEAGVINGSRKTIHRGKIILAFVLGSKELFDYVDNNPLFEFHPNKYTNDPWVISQNDKMVAVNSALQVDITGQVCADSIGTYFYSGIGGQVDFIRGASHSKGGKPIIAIPSTAKSGAISRIAPMLDPGAGVVTSRGTVHYVVTEYGVAYLHGRTIRQRAESLIEIAHPKFRDELYAYCEKTRWLQRPALQER